MAKQTLLPGVIINPSEKPVASVIWLHGLGADGHDFESIVPELKLPKSMAIRFIFPHAPMRPVTINGGYIMRAWFDIKEISLNAQEDEKGIYEAEKSICDLIEYEHQIGIKYEHITLAGFSQGGALALHTGLRYSKKLGSIIALSSYLPLRNKFGKEINSTNKNIPIFMAHGLNDQIIPYPIAQMSYNKLIEQNYQITFKTYPMQHHLCQQEIEDISSWLNEKFIL